MHDHSDDRRSERNIRAAFFLNFGFTIIEFIGGALTGSLAITADALHDLGDAIGLGLSWGFERIARRRRTPLFSYGYRRFSLLAALVNGIILIVGSVFIFAEALPRLLAPEMPDARGMILFSLVGIAANGAAVLRLRGGTTLNEQVVTWHLLEDVLGWIAVFVVSIVLLYRDLPILDPLLSIFITLFVLLNVLRNLRKTLVIFLQGVPTSVAVEEVVATLTAISGVRDVHDVHLWSLDGEHHIMSVHLVVAENSPPAEVHAVKCRAREAAARSGISHATIEIEREGETCARCD